ncbi:hypothetical protein HanRHA438_Chr16g0747721 [Helianthus annuus]|nr:hypothetical protein HanRHA438_Chr16g0747721 [Helianthus annuus]
MGKREREREREMTRGRARRARARAVVELLISAINRCAWFHSKPSVGKPLLSHLPQLHHHYNTIIHHHPPFSII